MLAERSDRMAWFMAWFVKNYPSDTIISDPTWHGPRILAAAEFAVKNHPAPERAAAMGAARQSIEQDHVFQNMMGDWSELVGEEKHAEANALWKRICAYIDARPTASGAVAQDVSENKEWHEANERARQLHVPITGEKGGAA